MSKAVVLSSGGIDSATCFAIACEEYDEVIPIHYNYGQQTHDFERRMSENQTSHYQSEYPDTDVHELTVVDYRDVLGHFAGGVASDRDSFTTDDGELAEEDGRSTGYQPMRNLHLIGTGSGFADVNNADAVFAGMQAGDEATYPDCRPVFVDAISEAVNASLADDDDIDIRAPLLHLEKHEVITLGDQHEVPWEYTYSCYEAIDDLENPEPCGECPACIERAEGFLLAGVEDPFGTIEAVEENSPDEYEKIMNQI